MKYVVIGGVAGGASFACRLRRLDEFAEIKIYEKSNFVSYANCGLPYYISSTIDDKEKLTLQTPASLKARFNIDVFINSEVVEVFPNEHKILIKNLTSAEFFYDNYDKLIISTGAEAIKIAPLSNKIFELKTVEDTLKIKSYIEHNDVKTAAIIGGGFIGLEILENLAGLKIKTTLIEAQSHCLANLDTEMASLVHDELKRNGVDLRLNTLVKEIKEEKDGVTLITEKGEIKADILIQAIGVKPASSFLKDKLKLGFRNTVETDDNFLTSQKDIYAIGDVTSVESLIDKERSYIPLAGLANKEGRELANELIFNKHSLVNALGTSILKLFKLEIASTGFNEAQLKAKGIKYEKIYLTPSNHASYYPGSTLLTIKFLFNKETYDILGAQIIGENGADKRIDIIASMMKFKIKAYQLKDLELAYAPPFGSVKDPINMIGYMVENIKNGLIEQFYVEDIESIKKDENAILLDVRSKEEYELSHIEGSINIPVDELRSKLTSLDKSKKLYLICLSAIRSYFGCRILTQRGYKCAHLAGGFRIFELYNKIY